ncbi:hypothetical protein H0H92_003588 [Tricholoma furcatifolium]|nr:hypothetical protein H0H92_003588 [Tricholoma furcatifolium]
MAATTTTTTTTTTTATATADRTQHPTVFLPALARLSSQSTQSVSEALTKLRALYWPPPLPTHLTLPKRTLITRIHDADSIVPDSGYASAEEDEDEDGGTITHNDERLEILRADSLEREFSVRWTTGFIARSDGWIYAVGDDEVEQARREALLDEATEILALFVGDEAVKDGDDNSDEDGDEDEGPTMVRHFTFPTPGAPVPIEVQLHDAQMLEDDHTSVGLQSWGSCIRFGRRICAAPTEFSLPPAPTPAARKDEHELKPFRVLELGAGTGLLSILAAKLLELDVAREDAQPTIIATDFHPDVLANLAVNVAANIPPSSSSPSASPSASSSSLRQIPIQVHALDWESPTTTAPFDEPFDLILAADVIYHPDHARWIRGCVEKLLRRPSASPNSNRDPDSKSTTDTGGVFWMFNAVRQVGRHEGLAESVGLAFDEAVPEPEPELDGMGMALRILEMEETGREEGIGRADESGSDEHVDVENIRVV